MANIGFECVQIETLVYNGRGYAVVLMPYSLCCTLYGDLLARNLNRSTEVVFIFCAMAKINLKN